MTGETAKQGSDAATCPGDESGGFVLSAFKVCNCKKHSGNAQAFFNRTIMGLSSVIGSLQSPCFRGDAGGQ
uniref:Uncharacterized protein n=1 Tax=Knipowitschia caucasica TaxID=637954 RepID=A0AAV2LB93_KNICA